MITIFNRKEIYHGFSMEDCYNIRSMLSGNRIDYSTRTMSPFDSSSRSSGRGLGINMDYAYEYYVYVHKKDYDQAVFLLNQK
ncbi:MAG: hypothetical protein K0R19_3018 [Bacillota bacterium]|nr:hypothetical protein [Bacillota bacterium]